MFPSGPVCGAVVILLFCAGSGAASAESAGEAAWRKAQAHHERARSGGADAVVQEQHRLAALRRATMAGHAPAAAELGGLLIDQSQLPGLDPDRATQVRADGETLLRLAADAGETAAIRRLAELVPPESAGPVEVVPPAVPPVLATPAIDVGTTDPPDPRPTQAPEAPQPPTQDPRAEADFDRGLLALRGADYRAARRLFHRSAALGHPGAHNNLGLMWWRGLGGAADTARAVKHLEQAIALGHLPATESLATAYQFGVDVRADTIRAIGLWQMAAQRGSDRAASALEALGVPTSVIRTARLDAAR